MGSSNARSEARNDIRSDDVLRQLAQLQEAAERARREADKAQGVYEQQLAVLRSEFGVTDLDAAEALLEELHREEDTCAAQAETLLEQLKTDLRTAAEAEDSQTSAALITEWLNILEGKNR